MIEKEYCYQVYQVKSENGNGCRYQIRLAAREVGAQGEWHPVDRFDSIDQYKKAIRKADNLLKKYMGVKYGY